MNNSLLSSHSLKWGGILAGVGIVLSLPSYFMDLGISSLAILGFLGFVVGIVLIVYGGIQYRTSLGGYADLKTMFISIMLVLVIAGAITLVFQLLVFSASPDIRQQQVEGAVRMSESILDFFPIPPDEYDEALEEAEKEAEDNFSNAGLISSYFWGWIFYAILALIIGAILMKKKPLFEQD